MTEPNIGIIVQQLNTMAREGEKVSDIDTSREAVIAKELEVIAHWMRRSGDFEKRSMAGYRASSPPEAVVKSDVAVALWISNAEKIDRAVAALLDAQQRIRELRELAEAAGAQRDAAIGAMRASESVHLALQQRAEAAEKALSDLHGAFVSQLLADKRLHALSRMTALDCFDRAVQESRSTDHKPASEGKPELLCEKCQTPGAYILPRVGYWVHAYEHADKSRDHDFVPRFAPAPEQHP